MLTPTQPRTYTLDEPYQRLWVQPVTQTPAGNTYAENPSALEPTSHNSTHIRTPLSLHPLPHAHRLSTALPLSHAPAAVLVSTSTARWSLSSQPWLRM